MEPPDRFVIRWEDFGANTRVALRELREEREFCDVTIVAGDGKQVEASKVVLAAGSSFFHKILRENPHPHPLIYLKGVAFKHLLSVLDFMYTGEASIAEEDLKQFIDITEEFKIKGFPTTSFDPPENQITVGKSSSSVETHPYSSRSLPRKGQVAAEEASVSHGISRVDIQENPEVTEKVSSPMSKAFNYQSFASSNGQNSAPQSTREEDHGASCDVKEEVNNNDMELVTKWSQIEPEVIISEAERDEEEDIEEQDEYIDVKEEKTDSTLTTEDAVVKDNSANLDLSFIENSHVKSPEQTNGDDTIDSTKPTLTQEGENTVYEVTCKETRGEFYQEKFISGCKGECILSYGIWMTPNEFQTMAGSLAKKYKQSLRVNGRPISELIDPNGNRPNTPSVQQNSKAKGDKHFKKGNGNSDKIKLVKNYESVGACSTFESDDIITSDDEIDLSGIPITMSLQENTASLDESYVMKVGQSSMDESYKEDAILIDLDNIDKYRSPIGSKTRIKQVSDNDVSEIVNLEQFEKEKKSSNESTDCNMFDNPKVNDKCSKSDEKKDNARFSDSQRSGLQKAFNENNFLSKEKAQSLSQELCITEKQAKIWFNNSRAQQRKRTLKKILGEIEKYSCETCSRVFVDKSKFKKHMSSHESEAFQMVETSQN